jgi:Holliday junction resolvase RusA-like endonuclease
LDKLVRLIGDACKGVVYADDSQVISVHARKEYAAATTGVSIMVEMMPQT